MNTRRLFLFRAQRPEIELHQFRFDQHTLDGAVDHTEGIIRGVSLITSGVTARGHSLEIDDTTVEQLYNCAVAKKKVPVKLNHKSGIVEMCGWLENFSIDGKKLRGDWHLLKSHSEYATTLERAEFMPECFGLSAAFMGKEQKIKGGKKAARCDELISVDCVTTPAANPEGLLEARLPTTTFDTEENSNMPNFTRQATQGRAPAQAPKQPATLDDILAALGTINGRLDASEQFQQDILEEINSERGEEGEGEEEGDGDGEGAEIEGEGDGGEIEGEGEGELVGASEGAGESQLSRDLGQALTYLESRLQAREDAEENETLEHAFSVINGKVELLIAENDALHEALVNQGGKTLEFSQGEGGMRYFSASNAGDAYEQRVAELQEKEGKKPTEAIMLAMREDGGVNYAEHQKRLGIIHG